MKLILKRMGKFWQDGAAQGQLNQRRQPKQRFGSERETDVPGKLQVGQHYWSIKCILEMRGSRGETREWHSYPSFEIIVLATPLIVCPINVYQIWAGKQP